MEGFEKELTASEKSLAAIRERRPSILRIHDLGVWSKLPYKALVVSGGLLWRSEEMGRNAVGALRGGDIGTGVLLTRGILENTLLHWFLMEEVERRAELGSIRLDEQLTRMMFGNKATKSPISPINVLTTRDRLAKRLPDISQVYEMLSDGSHPNYDGVHGLYPFFIVALMLWSVRSK